MREYFIHRDHEQLGPFNFEELKTKHIKKDTLIWYDGLEEWTTADQIDELKELIYVPLKEEFNAGKILISIFTVLSIVVSISSYLKNTQKVEYKDAKRDYAMEIIMESIKNERTYPADYLNAEYKFNKKNSGNVKGSIINNAISTSYTNAIARVTYYDKNNKEIGLKEYTIKDTFKIKSTSNFNLKIESIKNTNTIQLDIINADVFGAF